MDNGWVKLYKKFIKNPIWLSQDSYLIQLFLYCLLKANWKDTEVIMGNEVIKLKRGQFITGRKSLVIALTKHRHENTQIFKKYEFLYRRKLFLLEKMNFLHIKSTNKYTVITIRKYNEYQDYAQQMHNRCTTDAQQMHTDKEYKEDKKREIRLCQTSLIPCKDDCFWEIGMKKDTHKRNVLQKSTDLQDYIEDHPRKYKTFHKTLSNWVKGDLVKGYIPYMSEAERMEMEYDSPEKIAQRKKLHEEAIQGGVL